METDNYFKKTILKTKRWFLTLTYLNTIKYHHQNKMCT